MKVRCIKTLRIAGDEKNSITKGKVYEIEQDDKFFSIVNDRGVMHMWDDFGHCDPDDPTEEYFVKVVDNGITKRNPDHPRNKMDVGIFKSSIKDSIESSVGLCTLPLDECESLIAEVLKDIKDEASKFDTFDEYWTSF